EHDTAQGPAPGQGRRAQARMPHVRIQRRDAGHAEGQDKGPLRRGLDLLRRSAAGAGRKRGLTGKSIRRGQGEKVEYRFLNLVHAYFAEASDSVGATRRVSELRTRAAGKALVYDGAPAAARSPLFLDARAE